jgi:hypothetical protein
MTLRKYTAALLATFAILATFALTAPSGAQPGPPAASGELATGLGQAPGNADRLVAMPGSTALAGSGPGAEKQYLLGPAGSFYCSTLLPFPGENPSMPLEGFVIFNQANGKVMATVSIKDGEPNTDYPVRLIQANDDSCFIVDGVLITNDEGKGTIRISEDVVSSAAQVIVNTRALLTKPTYRGTEPYLLS